MNTTDKFTIYTDGSCDNIQYPNYGGWAYIIIEDEKIIEQKSGYDIHTTNNRMEMVAIIRSLEELPIGSQVDIYSDSEYCIGIFTKKMKPRTNYDLITEYFGIVESRMLQVNYSWVKGHSGDKYNEMVDGLANAEFERASGKQMTDYERLKKDKAYRKKVFDGITNERNKQLVEIIKDIMNSQEPRGEDYISEKVRAITSLFKIKPT